MTTQLPNLVLIPGLLCSDALFAYQKSALSDIADVRIGRILHHDSLSGMAQAILATSPERFALAGLSLGGFVAFEILRQAPERVTKLALLNTNARADRAPELRLREMLLGLSRTLGVRAVQSAVLPMLVRRQALSDRVLVSRVLKMADAVGRPAFERQQAAIIARPDSRPFLSQIKCPTMIIVGEQDAMTPPKVAEEMRQGIAGSQLEIIPDCGHLSTMEQPEAVTQLLRRWLGN